MGRLLLAVAVALCGAPAAGHSAPTMRAANTVSRKPVAASPGRPALQATGFETLFYLRNNDQAIRDYSEAIRIDPAYAKAYNGRCWAYGLSRRPHEGLKDCNESLRLDVGPQKGKVALWEGER